MDREVFANARELLWKKEKEIKYPLRDPKEARHLAKDIVKESGLRGDTRERYFLLLATSALLGKEQMYWNFKAKRRKHEDKESNNSSTKAGTSSKESSKERRSKDVRKEKSSKETSHRHHRKAKHRRR